MHTAALAMAVVLNASANLLLKFGMKAVAMPSAGGTATGGTLLRMATSPLIWLGLVFFALNVPLYAFALGRFKVSLAYPIMTGCGFGIIVTVAALSGLQERLDWLQLAGVALILAGVIVVSSRLSN